MDLKTRLEAGSKLDFFRFEPSKNGQFELSQDVTKLMWRSSLNKIREIGFPKDALDDQMWCGKHDHVTRPPNYWGVAWGHYGLAPKRSLLHDLYT
jgi:hypothetical protein